MTSHSDSSSERRPGETPRPHSPFDLTGRTTLITGAAGILGRAFARALAAHGSNLVLVDLDEGTTSELATEVTTEYPGPRVAGLACDVADPTAVKGLVPRAEEAVGPVDVLVSNAATKGSDLAAFLAPVEESSLETWREVMRVNLDGAFLMAQAFGARSIERGAPGSIIQTGSIYGLLGPDLRIYEGSEYQGLPIHSPAVYSASKGGIIGLTRYLAAVWGEKGIRVNAVVPGGVFSGQNATFVERYSQRVPLGRMAEPEEIANPVVFLASDASRYMTGQAIMVDGGLSAW